MYRMKEGQEVDEEYARSIAAKFGITGDPVDRTLTGWFSSWS